MKLTTFGKFLAIAAAIALGGMATIASAGTIATWTFETSLPAATNSATIGPLAAEVGTGSASGVHASATTDYSNPVGNGSLESFSSNEWAIGDYYQFLASSTGLSQIGISWDQTRSSTGPASFKVQYSTDGSSFVDLPDYAIPAISWSSGTPDATGTTSFTENLGAISALDNQASIYFRLTATAAPSSTGGTNRVDNFRISEGEVPEPATLALVGLAGLTLVGVARRRS
ncbi:MAG: PEP-CTERM sorting domain-containing protein [Pirellulales bacterium]